MKKTDIERIIKQGSTKQKIKLYFTDIAYFNIEGVKTAVLNETGNISFDTPDQILTDRERDIIYNSIKERKDIKYYNELRTWNKAFLMYKPHITIYAKNFNILTTQLSKFSTARLFHQTYENAINNILDVVEDRNLRETLVKTAIENLIPFDAKKYQEEGFLPFIEIPEANLYGQVFLTVEVLNEKIQEAKDYIKGIEMFLNKVLPLQPYKQFLKEREDEIKAKIQECKWLIRTFILHSKVPPELTKNTDDMTREELIDEILQFYEQLKILDWDKVEVKVTDEDIENIKNAGG